MYNIFHNFIFMDENKMGEHDYTNSMAQDENHLNVRGAVYLTNKIDSLLKKIK